MIDVIAIACFVIGQNHGPAVTFIGLNPSIANETTDDPTIKKIIKIARFNGYGKLYMVNLFSIVSANPAILVTSPEPLHHLTDLNIHSAVSLSDAVVFAWGNFREAETRALDIVRRFPDALCLKQNKNGSPKHPLYCKDESPLIKFNL